MLKLFINSVCHFSNDPYIHWAYTSTISLTTYHNYFNQCRQTSNCQCRWRLNYVCPTRSNQWMTGWTMTKTKTTSLFWVIGADGAYGSQWIVMKRIGMTAKTTLLTVLVQQSAKSYWHKIIITFATNTTQSF